MGYARHREDTTVTAFSPQPHLPLVISAVDMANVETKIQQEIRLGLGTRDDVRLFRNQVGQLPDPRTGRPVQFGLARGSADLVGWKTIEVTPDMVGQRLAIFTSIEVKTPTGRATPAQKTWMDVVEKAGGIAGIARSADDAMKIVGDSLD